MYIQPRSGLCNAISKMVPGFINAVSWTPIFLPQEPPIKPITRICYKPDRNGDSFSCLDVTTRHGCRDTNESNYVRKCIRFSRQREHSPRIYTKQLTNRNWHINPAIILKMDISYSNSRKPCRFREPQGDSNVPQAFLTDNFQGIRAYNTSFFGNNLQGIVSNGNTLTIQHQRDFFRR